MAVPGEGSHSYPRLAGLRRAALALSGAIGADSTEAAAVGQLCFARYVGSYPAGRQTRMCGPDFHQAERLPPRQAIALPFALAPGLGNFTDTLKLPYRASVE